MSKRAEEAAVNAYPHLEQATFDEMYPRLLFTRNTERSAFVQGYEQAEKDLGWHSVDESLPPVDEEVIVLTNRVRDIELDSANRICFAHVVDRSLAVDWDGWNIPGVKYWMPMPKLKKEDEK